MLSISWILSFIKVTIISPIVGLKKTNDQRRRWEEPGLTGAGEQELWRELSDVATSVLIRVVCLDGAARKKTRSTDTAPGAKRSCS